MLPNRTLTKSLYIYLRFVVFTKCSLVPSFPKNTYNSSAVNILPNKLIQLNLLTFPHYRSFSLFHIVSLDSDSSLVRLILCIFNYITSPNLSSLPIRLSPIFIFSYIYKYIYICVCVCVCVCVKKRKRI